jgi:hypothetical protein
MKRLTLVCSLAIVLAACTADPEPVTTTEGTLTGLPCDVRAVLQARCAGCHTGQTYAPEFASRDNLLAPFMGATWGDLVVTRMNEGKMPPYYAPQPSAADKALVVAWVAAGMPAGACAALTPPTAP